MTNQPPRELFVSERPVRSEFSDERSYARRRMATVAILALVLGGMIYAFWGRNPPNPADIPTIKAEGAYKQKPADPGGIDIPHQDVRVYDELEGKNAAPAQVEHLLPPPETPKEIAHAAPVATPAPAVPAPVVAEQPPAPPIHKAVQESAPVIAPVAVKNVKTTVAPIPAPPAPAPVSMVAATPIAATVSPAAPAPAAAPTSISEVIANTKTLAPAPSPVATPSAPASGSVAVQLASVSDEVKAKAMLLDLNKKYASALSGSSLHLVRADLGAKGVFYRIQSQGLTEEGANHICSSLKQMNAGCILVRK